MTNTNLLFSAPGSVTNIVVTVPASSPTQLNVSFDRPSPVVSATVVYVVTATSFDGSIAVSF